VAAGPQRCMEVLTDVGGYPRWSRLVTAVEPLSRGRLALRVEVMGLPVEMDCVLATHPSSAVLERVPYHPSDRETYLATWSVEPAGSGSRVRLAVEAELDAPGPARLLRGRVTRALVDGVLDDFTRVV
jgi:hypothetical protein